jgi:putative YpdA family bacillithiol system oxidoreductase
MDVYTIIVAIVLAAATMLPRFLKYRAAEKQARRKLEKTAGTELNVPLSLHPHIDALQCIGCGACVRACPEDGVLGLVSGKATLVHAAKCVGHGLCAEQCPVGAIKLQLGTPGRSANLPALNDDLETNVPGIYIAGELGGLGLIKNAIRQGIQVVDHIANRERATEGELDVAIVGAGPAGLSAGLASMKHGLKYAVLEQGDKGGTILQYPRRKIVMTQPADLPLYGRIKLTEVSKEALLELWTKIIDKTGLEVRTNEKVNEIQRTDSSFELKTSKAEYRARHVVLALGRRGTPRKLGVPGEDLSKVCYRLIDAESYKGCKVLVVGGGDSAVEAAIALASQPGSFVTLSYRKGEFTRIKDRNETNIKEAVRKGTVRIVFNSNITEIREESFLLQSEAGVEEIENDAVFVFVGGELPYEFLKKAGVELQSQAV